MSTPALADLAALGAWVGEDLDAADTTEKARASAVLAAASALARAEAGRSWLNTDGTLAVVPDEVSFIVVQAAARVWRNPEGWIQDTTGPYTVRYSEQVGSGLYLAADEKTTLRRFRTRGPLGTITVTRENPTDARAELVPTPDGQPIPWLPS